MILAGGVDSVVLEISCLGVECCWYRLWLGVVIGETGELGELQTPSSWVYSNAKSCSRRGRSRYRKCSIFSLKTVSTYLLCWAGVFSSLSGTISFLNEIGWSSSFLQIGLQCEVGLGD